MDHKQLNDVQGKYKQLMIEDIRKLLKVHIKSCKLKERDNQGIAITTTLNSIENCLETSISDAFKHIYNLIQEEGAIKFSGYKPPEDD